MTLLKKFSNLHLSGIELNLNLGWSAEERITKQKILVDVLLNFFEPPKACLTDNIKDTSCYGNLINILISNTETQEFHLVEHLGAHIYQLIKNLVPNAAIQVSIHKDLSVVNLTGSVAFQYGDKDN